ncbi:MAG: hypothetical protein ACHQUC_08660, partial [Chlamydiales bacterium]
RTSIMIRTIAAAAAAFAALVYALNVFVAPLSWDPIAIFIVGLASFKIALLWEKFEEWRAARALDKIAVDLFMKEDHVPTQIMERIRFNRSAINELCLRPGSDLNKIDMKGKTLLESVLFAEKTFRTNEENDRLAIMKLLLSHGAKLKTDNRNYFLEVVDKLSSEYVSCILENDFIKPSDLSDEELFQCWPSIKDPKIAQMFFQKGFKLNVKNANGQTPLEWAEANKMEDLIRSLKKARDPTPPLHFEAHVFDVRKPAISVGGKYDSFQINRSDIFLRTMLVALPIFYALLVVAIEATVFLPFALPLVALPWVYYKFEWKRAVEKLNTLALQSFNNPLPPAKVVGYMARTESAIDQLLVNGSDITKPGENGTTLWKSTCNPGFSLDEIPFSTRFTIFKKLTNRLFAPGTPVEMRQAHLIEAIKSGHPEFVEHLLKNKWIQADELSSEQQFQCWIALQDVKSTALLKTYGFDTNARNCLGFTPLLYLLSPIHFGYLHSSGEKNKEEYSLIKALLEAGADVHAKTEAIDGDSAIDLVQKHQNLAIKQLIEQAAKQ